MKSKNGAVLWMKDRMHDVLFGLVSLAGVRQQREWLQKIFEHKYRTPDPYEFSTNSYEQTKYHRTMDMLPQDRYEHVLELGCAEGVFTQMLTKRYAGAEIVGVDIAEAALARARTRCEGYPGISLRRANIVEDFPEGTFDLIFCAEVLYYLGTRQREIVYKHLLGALAPSGTLVAVNFEPRASTLHSELGKQEGLTFIADEFFEPEDGRSYSIAVFRAETKSVPH